MAKNGLFGGGKDGDVVNETINMTIVYSLLGALAAGLLGAIASVVLNFTVVDFGNDTLNTLASGALGLLVGWLAIKGFIRKFEKVSQ